MKSIATASFLFNDIHFSWSLSTWVWKSDFVTFLSEHSPIYKVEKAIKIIPQWYLLLNKQLTILNFTVTEESWEVPGIRWHNLVGRETVLETNRHLAGLRKGGKEGREKSQKFQNSWQNSSNDWWPFDFWLFIPTFTATERPKSPRSLKMLVWRPEERILMWEIVISSRALFENGKGALYQNHLASVCSFSHSHRDNFLIQEGQLSSEMLAYKSPNWRQNHDPKVGLIYELNLLCIMIRCFVVGALSSTKMNYSSTITQLSTRLHLVQIFNFCLRLLHGSRIFGATFWCDF